MLYNTKACDKVLNEEAIPILILILKLNMMMILEGRTKAFVVL